ncbi:MAG: sensor histidine kinase [Anaerolineales bacterium]|nr:MAG: sensor histidine kinase [Anaerolineales bacterium]
MSASYTSSSTCYLEAAVVAKKPLAQNELPFFITARTALLLGRESISSPVVAVLELVKNSYDADAKSVTVRFRKASTPEGTIEILDDGHGMGWEDIETKWMVIGTDNKLREPISPGGRIRVGDKGIGRFALDRLASQVILETTPKPAERGPAEPTYRMAIDWDGFVNTTKALHEIPQPIRVLQRQEKSGTHLLLRGLRDSWTRREYVRLYRNLVVLVPPFESKLKGFNIRFDCDEARDLSGRIRSPMAKAALFKMRAKLDENKQVRISITTRDGLPGGRLRPFKRYRRTWQELFDIPEDQPVQPQCGPLEFELYFYLRASSALKGTGITVTQLREFLGIYGGVRIYRDGFRVKPYGDPGGAGDWLGLNARRVTHPAGVTSGSRWVIAENQVAASVFISRQTNPDLRDQTNREGLFDNQALRDMRSFVLKCIEVFETDRQQYERSKLGPEPPTVEEVLEEAEQDIIEGIDRFGEVLVTQTDSPQKTVLADALDQFREAQVERFEAVRTTYQAEQQEIVNKHQLLQNLATVGIAASSMGHEVLEASRKVMYVVKQLGDHIASLTLLFDDKVEQYMKRLYRYSQIIYSISNFALRHTGRDKRRRDKVNVNSLIQELHKETLQEICTTNEADITLKLGDVPDIYAFPYEIESIVVNFVTNSLAAFRRGRIPMANRHIQIETRHNESDRQLQIIARDSGPGIPKGDTERIFGIYSTKVDDEGRPIGTGLGLAIVKDIVDSHKGSIEVKEHGNVLPGAEFIVTLPVPRKRGRRKGRGNGK